MRDWGEWHVHAFPIRLLSFYFFLLSVFLLFSLFRLRIVYLSWYFIVVCCGFVPFWRCIYAIRDVSTFYKYVSTFCTSLLPFRLIPLYFLLLYFLSFIFSSLSHISCPSLSLNFLLSLLIYLPCTLLHVLLAYFPNFLPQLFKISVPYDSLSAKHDLYFLVRLLTAKNPLYSYLMTFHLLWSFHMFLLHNFHSLHVSST